MKLFGTDLMAFVGDTPRSIAFAKNHTLDLSMNTVDTSTKDNGLGRWGDSEAGLRQWTVSSENIVGDGTDPGASMDELLQKFMDGEKVDIVFALQSNIADIVAKKDEAFVVPEGGWTPGSNYYKGKALITALNISAPNGEYATGTVTFTGCGNLQRLGNGIQKAALRSAGVPVAPAETVKTETAAIKK